MSNRYKHSIRCLAALVLCLLVGHVSAQTLRRGLGPEPDSIDIHQAQGLAAINLLRDLREGLLTFDAAGELMPGVAASWEVLEKGTLYRFTLKPDARWSNGDPVTAEDFVRGWRRAFNPATSAVTAGLLNDVVNAGQVLRSEQPVDMLGIIALADGRLEIRLTYPAPSLLELLAHPVSYPLHELHQDDARQAPVNGAFQLSEWVPRSVIRLVRNELFHSAEQVASEVIEYFPIEDANSELARYRAGELDITETIPPGRFAWLQKNLPGELRISPYLGTFWLGLNLNYQPLGDSLALREALALAIDRETLTRVVLGAGELPAWGIVPPGIAGYQPRQMATARLGKEEREALARRRYSESGFARNRKPLLELRYNTSGVHRRMAVAVAAMWKQVLGLNVELINEEWKVFVNNRRMGVVTQVFRGGWIADYADPGSFLDLFLGNSELNTTFYRDSEFDALMQASALRQGQARMELLQTAEAHLLQAVPVIPLYYYVSRHLVKPTIGGYQDNVRDIHLSRYLNQAPD